MGYLFQWSCSWEALGCLGRIALGGRGGGGGFMQGREWSPFHVGLTLYCMGVVSKKNPMTVHQLVHR